MKSMELKKLTICYLVFFNLLSFAKGIGLDSNNGVFVLIAIFASLFLIIQVLNERYYLREILIILLFLILGGVVLIFSKKTTILVTIITVILAKNIPFKELIKSTFIFKIVGFVITVLLGCTGIIESGDVLRITNSGEIIMRYALGYIHPNITYLNFFVIIVMYIYLRYEKLKAKDYFFIILLSIILYKATNCRTGISCVYIMLIFTIILKNDKIMHNKLVRKLIVLSPIICGSFIVGLGLYYSNQNSILKFIDDALSGRLELTKRFLTMYSLKPFGQHIIEGGNVNGSYLRIDSGYVSLLLGYGLVTFILFISLEIIIIKKYIKLNMKKEILLIVSFLVYGITEVYIYNVFVNVSLIFLRDLLYKDNKKLK